MEPVAMNRDFARRIIDGAMDLVRERLRGESRGFGNEIWYPIDIPYLQGSEEYAYFSALLNGGSMKDANYLDLFQQVMKGMHTELEKVALRSFATLNCRFDTKLTDNFVLYVFLS